jgi:hypothetical protein
MTPTSGANVANPTHHVVLTDPAGTSLGLMICDPNGKNAPTQIRRAPYPRTGLKITQGVTKYADKELPFADAHQENWNGGRGALNLEDDLTRFADSFRIHTEYEGVAMNGPKETYATGFRTGNSYWTAPSTLYPIAATVDAVDYIAVPFTPATNYNIGTIQFWARRVSAPPWNLVVHLYSDSGGNPNTYLTSYATLSYTAGADLELKQYTLTFSSAVALTAGTQYWLVFFGVYSSTGYWEVAADVDATNPGRAKVHVGGSWAALGYRVIFRVLSNTDYTDINFFEYKGALYAVTSRPTAVADVYIYINGDRGVADASAAATLVDATKTWITTLGATALVGATVKIIRGTGSDQRKPYRTIASYTETALTVSSAWDTIPDTTSEYVITKTNVWQNDQELVFCGKATDVAVAGEFVYIAADAGVARFRCYNSGGTYTKEVSFEQVSATRLLSTYDSGNQCYYLWGAAVEDQFYGVSSLWKMRVPPLWEDLYTQKGDLLTFDQPWDDLVITNVTVAKSASIEQAITIAPGSGFTTGVLAAKYLPSAIDITEGTDLSFSIKSSKACSSTTHDLQLLLSDDEINPLSASPYYTGRTRPALGLQHETSAATFVDMAAAREGDAATSYVLTFTNAQYIYVIATKPFDTVRVALGTTKNTAASTLTAEYMSQAGGIWTAVTITDGTVTGSATFAKTGNIVFTPPYDWQTWTVNSITGYCIRFKVNNNLDASLNLLEVETFITPVAIDLPDLAANTWKRVDLIVNPLTRPFPDDSAIKSVGLYLATDLGAQTITLKGALEITSPAPKYISLQTTSKIKKLIQYGEERGNPWIITEDAIYEVQTENGDLVVQLPLSEIGQLASPMNGLAAVTNDVYLYWNMAQRLERYYSGKLEDLGPDRDEGLPSDRAGDIVAIVSHPGAIYAAVQGTVGSVLQRRSSGWHETYRCPVGSTIKAMYSQAIPGDNSKLWIAEGDDFVSIPLAMSKSDDYQEYTRDSSVVTPWITMSFLDVSKRYIGLKLYTEDLSYANGQYIRVYYQTESGELDGTWTTLSYASNVSDSTLYVTSPFEEKYFTNIAGRRIRFRFELTTTNSTKRPKLKAWILEAVLSMDVSNSYVLPVRLSDHATDLQNQPDETARIETIQAQIDAWAAAPPTILTMTSIYSPADNKSVIVQNMPLRPYKIQTGTAQDNYEAWIAEVTLLEVA